MLWKVVLAGIITLITASLGHTAFSWALGVQAEKSFNVRGPNVRFAETDAPNAKRLPFSISARSIDRAETIDLLHVYMHQQYQSGADHPNILFAGSSVSYGYPANADASISGAYQRVAGSAKIANISIVGADIPQVTETLCFSDKLPIDALFIEIPIINEVVSVLRSTPERLSQVPISCPSTTSTLTSKVPRVSYFSYFLQRSWGVTAPVKLRRFYPERDGNRVMRTETIPQSYQFDAAAIEANADIFRRRLEGQFKAARNLGVPVIAYPSPVYRPAFEQADIAAYLDAYQAIYIDTCMQFSEINCLEPMPSLEMEKSFFYNVSHINRDGAQHFAEILFKTDTQNSSIK